MALPTKNIHAVQRWSLRTGVIFTLVCATLTFMAGWSFGGGGVKSFVFATGFALVTFGAASLLPIVETAFSRAFYGAGLGLMTLWGVFAIGEFTGHLMVFAGQRHSDIQTSDLKTASYTDTANTKRDAEDALARARKSLADLIDANPWFATVSAQGLKDKLASQDEAIRQEEARGGCGPKCLGLKTARAALADQLGKVTAKTDYEQAVSQALAAVASARDKVANTTKGDSIAEHQSTAAGALIFATLRPDADERDWSNLMIEWLIAALFTVGPMGLIYGGVKDWDAPRRRGFSLISWILAQWAAYQGKGAANTVVVNRVQRVEDTAFREARERYLSSRGLAAA